MNNNSYENITGFNLWEIILYCFDKTSFLVITLIFIIAFLGFIGLMIVKLPQTMLSDSVVATACSLLVISVVTFIIMAFYMMIAPSDMDDDRVEANIIAKYDISGAKFLHAVDEEQGVYLVKLFDRDSMETFPSEVWFDPISNEPTVRLSPDADPNLLKSFNESILER